MNTNFPDHPHAAHSKFVYHFADESPMLWEEFLRSASFAGTEEVVSEVSWSAHEASRGVYDFSRSSRLKIEKFLTLAAQAGCKVKLNIGMSSDRDAFPRWTEGFAEPNLVPAEVLGNRTRLYGYAPIPHFFDEELRKSFLAFLAEVFQRLQLYKAPDGPVSSISINLGPMPYCQTLGAWNYFVEFLRDQYGSIAELNRFFQTSFKEFDSLTSALSFRTLLDKRPWQACYDFKKYRAKRTGELLAEITHLVDSYNLTNIFSNSWQGTEGVWGAANGVYFDDTLVESFRCRPILFSPWAQENGVLIRALRALEVLYESCLERNLYCAPLAGPPASGARTLVFVCGKYVSTSAEVELRAWLAAGKTIFFPFSVPKYAERLRATHWAGPSKRILIGGESFLECEVGGGRVLCRTKEEEISQRALVPLFETLGRLA